MIRVWGRPTSICTQRVLWCLLEAGLAWDLTLASAIMGPSGHISKGGTPFGLVDTPWFRAMNPNGAIPVIDDGGFILWESNAILLYLAMTYARTLYADDVKVLALASSWMGWSGEKTSEGMAGALHVDRLASHLRDPQAIRKSEAAMVAPLTLLDAHLAGRKFVASDCFTIGDISVAPAINRWFVYGLARPPTPHLDAWIERLSEREGFQRFLAPRDAHYDPA